MRNVAGVKAWYQDNKTSPPFDPDGQCLKVVRYARDIGPMYPSAISAAYATPKEHRVYDWADIRSGMIGFFDDPNDGNPYGHVVTFHARTKDKRGLTWTNSVKDNQLVLVYANYFPRYWGDAFLFAATWLNGQALSFPNKPQPKPKPTRTLENLQHAIKDLQDMIAHHRKKGNLRLVHALQRDLEHLRETLKEFE